MKALDFSVCIPVYANEDTIGLVDRCIETIDVEPDRVFIIDNTPNGLCKKYINKGFNLFFFPENLGVAASWNMVLEYGFDWTFLISCSERFPEGLSAVVKLLEKHDSEYIFMTMQGWHVTAINKKLVKLIGNFDENFYPAYCEDTDYVYRITRAQIPVRLVDIPAYCQKTAIGVNSGATVYPEKTDRYWRKKWGGQPNDVGFLLPFQDKPLNYWVKEKEENA